MSLAKRFLETNCVEFKRSWRDEWLKWICAFANSEGGVLYIGIDEKNVEARNELIAGALYRGGFVETWGRGIEKVCRECEKFGVARPEYDATESDVMVCLHARSTNSASSQELSPTPQETTIETTTETTTETATENLSEGTKKVLSAIIQMPTATLNEIAASIGMTRDGVFYHVKILRKEVGLKHEGPTKKGRWVLDGNL